MTLLTKSDWRHSTDLVKILEEANQVRLRKRVVVGYCCSSCFVGCTVQIASDVGTIRAEEIGTSISTSLVILLCRDV